MNCPSCNEEVRVGNLYCPSCGESLENIFRQEIEKPTPTQEIPVDAEQLMPEVPICDHCERQDDSLRIVAYPFVVSIIFVTFRREFRGLMCKKHQYQFLVLASVITATIGLLGIPFGIIFAPVALYYLARGGNQPKDANVQMLRSLANHKFSQGDTAGAIKCLEACLKFGENAEIQQEIQKIQLKLLPSVEEIRLRTKISSMLILLFGAALIGATIGILDYILTLFFSILFPGEVPIYLVILSWTPLVALAFMGGLALYQLIEWVITRTHLRNTLVAVGIAGLSAMVAAYSIAQGTMLSDYVYYLFVGGIFETSLDAISTGVVVILIGGLLWTLMILDEPIAGGIILIVLIVVIQVFYLVMAVRSAIKTVRWQKRIVVKDSILYH